MTLLNAIWELYGIKAETEKQEEAIRIVRQTLDNLDRIIFEAKHEVSKIDYTSNEERQAYYRGIQYVIEAMRKGIENEN